MMRLSDFVIGDDFVYNRRRYRCVDIGQWSLFAIPIEPREFDGKFRTTEEMEEYGAYQRPYRIAPKWIQPHQMNKCDRYVPGMVVI
jgi:hypothetical protein